ncbi:hypothetical protein ACFL3H_03380, partial [Gemmatimonadota bacterium]
PGGEFSNATFGEYCTGTDSLLMVAAYQPQQLNTKKTRNLFLHKLCQRLPRLLFEAAHLNDNPFQC